MEDNTRKNSTRVFLFFVVSRAGASKSEMRWRLDRVQRALVSSSSVCVCQFLFSLSPPPPFFSSRVLFEIRYGLGIFLQVSLMLRAVVFWLLAAPDVDRVISSAQRDDGDQSIRWKKNNQKGKERRGEFGRPRHTHTPHTGTFQSGHCPPVDNSCRLTAPRFDVIERLGLRLDGAGQESRTSIRNG